MLPALFSELGHEGTSGLFLGSTYGRCHTGCTEWHGIGFMSFDWYNGGSLPHFTFNVRASIRNLL